MIKNDEELKLAANEVSQKLQQIQDYLGDGNHDDAKIRFPYGYIRRCDEHRSRYSFLTCSILKDNISYALLSTDIYRWMLNRTNIQGTAQEMLIKQGISIIGNIVESIGKNYLHGHGGRNNYKRRTEILVEKKVIEQSLKNDLDWLWDQRNNIHIVLVSDREYQQYTMQDYNKAIRTLHQFRNVLNDHGPL
ncbi:hypothetical protein L1D31_21830 [Vibrio sp. Isolate23]|uniref:hypothetical protein n=1 Tax=Vibrio sp. Isolate23 TaxID=2908533 RepID=UPI001EFD9EF0|nr:hypothetical protein [Vibrio sp. Isolate23]MCG9685166.1 hypothetical protein [Vibrio sp. Isolate23]